MAHHTTDVLHYKQSIKAINKRNKRLESQFNGPPMGDSLRSRSFTGDNTMSGNPWAIQSSFVMCRVSGICSVSRRRLLPWLAWAISSHFLGEMKWNLPWHFGHILWICCCCCWWWCDDLLGMSAWWPNMMRPIGWTECVTRQYHRQMNRNNGVCLSGMACIWV